MVAVAVGVRKDLSDSIYVMEQLFCIFVDDEEEIVLIMIKEENPCPVLKGQGSNTTLLFSATFVVKTFSRRYSFSLVLANCLLTC
jgi:hypothetical protein